MTDEELETYPSPFAWSQEARPFAERCPRCSCQWHGLPCIQQIPVPTGGGTAPCMCPGGAS